VTRGFDVRWFTGDPNSSQADHDNFLNQHYSVGYTTFGRWVTRYATGKELGGGKYSPYEQLGNSCIDIYRYNEKTQQDLGSELEKENQI
jgi:hypothetical protein